MNPFLAKLTVCLFASIVFASLYHYWPKEPQYVGVRPDVVVEIYSSKGVVTEAKK